jgi:hypothetical protein
MKKIKPLFEIESVEMIEAPGKREDPDRAIKESRKRHKELVRLRGKKKNAKND